MGDEAGHGTARGHRAAAIEPRPRTSSPSAWVPGSPPRCPTARALRSTALEGTSANGMSSETLLFDASWTEDGRPADHRLVARVAPGADDVPVFPRYDLPGQFDAIRLVGELTDVPVPAVWWCEPDAGRHRHAVLRHEPRRRAGPARRHAVQLRRQLAVRRRPPPTSATCRTPRSTSLAHLHAVDRPAERFSFLVPTPGAASDGDPLRRRVALTRAWYEFAAARRRSRRRWSSGASPGSTTTGPTDEGDAVLSWGDSRIGNMMFDGFDPVAVLDWEMAGVGPRELDVAG